jgi:ferredoxin-NADP reductase/MOSC domain-containing protein YiiM
VRSRPVLLSVNVGKPRDVSWQGRTIHTGVWKGPVPGPVMVRRLNIDGDGQGDTAGHGGEQRAVLVYQVESYRHWRQHLGRRDLEYGVFGENLTVDGLPDDEVCIGDRYRIGEAEFEVTQPRVTCYRVGVRVGEPELPALLVSHHRPGFYMRVVTEGNIKAGDEILKTMTGPGALTVADTDALLYLPDPDPAKFRVALDIPALSPGWQGSFRDLLRGKGDGVPVWNGFRSLRVTRIVIENDSVTSVFLTADDDSRLPQPRGGQYLTLRLPGAGTPVPVRNYSLSSAPDSAEYRISVKREPHGLSSTYLTTALKSGQLLEAAAPRGDFVLDDDTDPVLLVSAGIGVTPVLAMLHELASTHSAREVWWLHGARRPDEHPLAAEAHALLATLPNPREHVFYSAATAAEPRGSGTHAGHLDARALAALDIPVTGSAYICGPESFMADTRQALTAAGVDPARIHTELFGSLPPITPGIAENAPIPPHPPPGPPGSGPLVTFARSGMSAPFADTRRNLLELAEVCDVPARWSCRTGVCHTCLTDLLSGEISYSPEPLDPPPERQALLCCSRPDSDIVLDL